VKPCLYSIGIKDGENHAALVDLHSVFSFKDEGGRTRTHFGAAINIHRFRVGDFSLDDSKTIVYPVPCVWQLHKEMKIVGLEARGIRPDAAVVLLKLAASANNLTIQPGRKVLEFGAPLERDAEINWCQWKFIAAWMWSSWRRDGEKSATQYQHMKALGYPKTHAAFRQMMGRIGFVTAKG